MPKVSLRTERFDAWREIAEYQAGIDRVFGATSVFVGTMRAESRSRRVQKMFLEHYAGMTEASMRQATEAALDENGAIDALVLHRVGHVSPSEPIVLIAVWSEHRAAATRASKQILEVVKSTVPFWKKEYLDSGTEWVKENTPAE